MNLIGQRPGRFPKTCQVLADRVRKNRAEQFGLWERLQGVENLHLLEPVGLVENVCLMDHARLVLTDSGGVREETTALGIPCLTLRENTERPVTVLHGTNQVVGIRKKIIVNETKKVLKPGFENHFQKPLYWDGKTSERIIKILNKYFSEPQESHK